MPYSCEKSYSSWSHNNPVPRPSKRCRGMWKSIANELGHVQNSILRARKGCGGRAALQLTALTKTQILSTPSLKQSVNFGKISSLPTLRTSYSNVVSAFRQLSKRWGRRICSLSTCEKTSSCDRRLKLSKQNKLSAHVRHVTQSILLEGPGSHWLSPPLT